MIIDQPMTSGSNTPFTGWFRKCFNHHRFLLKVETGGVVAGLFSGETKTEWQRDLETHIYAGLCVYNKIVTIWDSLVTNIHRFSYSNEHIYN